jgi:phosphatidate cytidylyltransferase
VPPALSDSGAGETGAGKTGANTPEPNTPKPNTPGPNMPGPGRSARWGDLGKRVGSAVILAPLALACLWLGKGPWAILIALGAGGCAAEWAGMCRARPREWPVLLLPLGMALVPIAALVVGAAWALILPACLTVIVWALFGRDGRAAWLAAGFVYLAPAAVAMVRLRHIHLVGRWDMLFLVLIIWASDIGAYLVGRLVGGPKLAPAISPGKTWSGAAGGLVAAGAVGIAVAAWAGGRLPLPHCVAIAVILGAASQIGDLLESWFKRHFGVKDSGRSIPGHGGLLDRLDGMLTAAPAAALLAAAIGGGVLLWQ